MVINKIKKLKPVKGWAKRVCVPQFFTEVDNQIAKLGNSNSLDKEDYREIFTYLVSGVSAYASMFHSQVLYPGVSGTRGELVEGIEGFARTSTMLAAWLMLDRDRVIITHSGKRFDISDHLRVGLANGTDPNHPEYWGNMEDYDQRCVEAGDIAVTFWLFYRNQKTEFTKNELENIYRWLVQINRVNLYGGNWCLFKLIVNLVLSQFDQTLVKIAKECFEEFKSFYVGDGWFGDGVNGFVDYYNVWQMQYFLFWINEIAPEFEPSYIKSVIKEFSEGYKYMVSPKGLPMFGRSSSYRLAASTPLIIDSLINNQNCGVARRALDCTWAHFISHGALKDGRITQGYYSERPELLENYSGRASPMWSLRSLTLAFMCPEHSCFWNTPGTPLPIEQGDYDIEISGPNFRIIGKQGNQEITLIRNKPYFENNDSSRDLPPLSIIRKLGQLIFRRPLRDEHLNIKYGRKVYISSQFFCP